MTLAQKQEFKDLVNLVEKASHIIGYNWPMTYFVHHNPINSLENLPFHEAIRLANRFLGSQGYLTNEIYRNEVNAGRIKLTHLDAAIKSYISKTGIDDSIELSGKKINKSSVIRTHLLIGITAPFSQFLGKFIDAHPDEKAIRLLTKKIHAKHNKGVASSLVYKNMTAIEWCDLVFDSNLEDHVNNELIKWCEAFLDEGHATWSMPGREKGFYEAWRALAMNEWSTCGIRNSNNKIRALSIDPVATVLEKLNTLCIPKEYWQDYISRHLASLHGWSSFINWRSKNNEYEWQKVYPIDLLQYLAVRLFYECELVEQTCQNEIKKEGNFDTIVSFEENKFKENSSIENEKLEAAWKLICLADSLGIGKHTILEASPKKLENLLLWINELSEKEHGPIWLDAYEQGYINELICKLKTSFYDKEEENLQIQRPLAQLMFCIDVRSEPFRRNLELMGNYETYGFAGFFGIPISFCAHDTQHFTAQCPAIIQPKHVVHEVIRDGEKNKETKNKSVKKLSELIKDIFKNMKNHFIAPFVAVEAFGWFFGWHLIERTFYPGIYRKWQKRLTKFLISPVNTEILPNLEGLDQEFSYEKQVSYIEDALRTIGLTENFAKIVLVTGHTSLSDNNPYEAALNCGACGGNSGEPNSRLFTKIANNKNVRQQIKKNGIVIPEDTIFISAVHNTTTDDIQFFDTEDIPETHLKELNDLKFDLEEASIKNCIERCKKLPGGSNKFTPKKVKKEVLRRSGDWSETRPEWGLSGNASFIVGRRNLTLNVNLNGRAFLNSYDYTDDPKGIYLESILTGPMIVGQWINAEHYFSTTDPEIFGSGNKIYHNIVGNIGVMSGPQSDLRVGLPIQTTTNGKIKFHEPLRLCVLIEAPRKQILHIINRNTSLKLLCENEWVRFFSIETSNSIEVFAYKPTNGWEIFKEDEYLT